MFDLPDILPFAATCGIERVSAGADLVVLRLPAATAVNDHLGAVHAGALFTLAHVAFSELLALNVDLRTVSFRLRDAHLRVVRSARGDVVCRATLPVGARERVEAALESDGRALLATSLVVAEMGGGTVAEVDLEVGFRSLRGGRAT